jgi:hypothetical protein
VVFKQEHHTLICTVAAIIGLSGLCACARWSGIGLEAMLADHNCKAAGTIYPSLERVLRPAADAGGGSREDFRRSGRAKTRLDCSGTCDDAEACMAAAGYGSRLNIL